MRCLAGGALHQTSLFTPDLRSIPMALDNSGTNSASPRPDCVAGVSQSGSGTINRSQYHWGSCRRPVPESSIGGSGGGWALWHLRCGFVPRTRVGYFRLEHRQRICHLGTNEFPIRYAIHQSDEHTDLWCAKHQPGFYLWAGYVVKPRPSGAVWSEAALLIWRTA